MSTSKAKAKNDQVLVTPAGQEVQVGVATDHVATEALAPSRIINETDWFELGGFQVKAIQVAPSVYQAARSHLRALMRNNKPEPPMQKGPDGEMKPNPHTKAYKAAVATWEELYEDLDEDLFFSVAILAGLIIGPNNPPVPDEADWLPVIYGQLRSVGVNVSEMTETLMYKVGDPTIFTELMFKKYVLLNDPETFKAFMDFQQQQTSPGGVPAELLTRFAADMFRTKT